MGHMISRRGFALGMTSGLMASVPSSGGFAQGARLKTTIANAAGNLNLAVQELLRQQGYMEEFGLEPNFLNVADGAKILGGLLGGPLGEGHAEFVEPRLEAGVDREELLNVLLVAAEDDDDLALELWR